jgi:hypothetical protein
VQIINEYINAPDFEARPGPPGRRSRKTRSSHQHDSDSDFFFSDSQVLPKSPEELMEVMLTRELRVLSLVCRHFFHKYKRDSDGEPPERGGVLIDYMSSGPPERPTLATHILQADPSLRSKLEHDLFFGLEDELQGQEHFFQVATTVYRLVYSKFQNKRNDSK